MHASSSLCPRSLCLVSNLVQSFHVITKGSLLISCCFSPFRPCVYCMCVCMQAREGGGEHRDRERGERDLLSAVRFTPKCLEWPALG